MIRTRPVASVASALAALLLVQACTTRDVTSVSVASVVVQPGTASLTVGQEATFTAVVREEGGATITGAAVTWTSESPSVVSIGADGVARGLQEGTAVVRATVLGVSGTATVTVAPGPSLAVNPVEVAFFGTPGGPSPSARVVQVSNVGSGTLQGVAVSVTYAAGQPTGWLAAALGSTTGPSALILTPSIASLPVGTYSATVLLSAQNASNSPLALPVTLSLDASGAILDLTPRAVTLQSRGGSTRSTADVQVRNLGGASLTGLSTSVWYASASGGDWLSAGLSTTTAPATLTIEADPTGLDRGTYLGEVRVASSSALNSPEAVSVTFVVGETADVQVTASGPSASQEGDRVSYGVTVFNAGPDRAENVVVIDTLPRGTTLVSTSGGTLENGVVTWILGPLGASAGATLNLVVDIDPGTTGSIVNVARVASSTPDPDETNNRSVATTDVGALPDADMSVTKTGPAEAVAGTRITYSIEAANAGPDDARSEVVDTLPAGTTFASSTGGSVAGRVLTWDVGLLAAGASARIDVAVDVALATRGAVTNRAWIDGRSSDPNAASDSSAVVTTVTPPPGLSVSESEGSTSVRESGTTDTMRVVLNARPASNVVLSVGTADAGEVTVAPTTLTFTPATWNTPQVVQVTGVDDDLIDGTRTTVVTVSVVDASSDDAYDAVADRIVRVTTVDDDAPGLTVLETDGGTTVAEPATRDTITVSLNAQPASDVVVGLAASDPTEATIAPATLTFTPGDWSTAKAVVVTAADDPLADGDQASTVTLSVVDAGSDPAYASVADHVVSVTTTDDEVPALVLVDGPGAAVVGELGGTWSFTVALAARPLSDVVLTVSSADAGEATAAPASLTFAPDGWNTPRTVTVTGVDDNLADGDQLTTITVAVNAGASDDAFDGVASATRQVTTTDNESASFAVSSSSTPLVVSETGTTGQFTVVLGTRPVTDVVFDVTSDDPGEVTVAPARLTFTTSNWSATQAVTVTGVDDALADGDQTTAVRVSVDAGASDDAFDGLADRIMNVVTSDDESASFTVTPSTSPLVVSETGTTGTFTVVLATQPVADVVVDVTSGDPGEASVSPARLTFTPSTWNTARTVTVTGVDDDVADGDQSTTISVAVDPAASDDAFDGLAAQSVAVTTTDDESASFTVTPAAVPLLVSETGTTATFTVVLADEPTSTVVLDVSSDDPGEAAVSVASLTFQPGGGPEAWNAVRTVTVTGVDDAVADGNENTTIRISVNDAASDDLFDGVADRTVAVTTTDDEVASFTVTPTGSPLIVSESGSTATFTVVLDIEPGSSVIFDVTSDDTSEATVSPRMLVFTPSTWADAQTVTVTGVNDAVADGDVTITVRVRPTSGDPFDLLPAQTVTVTTTDDDAASFTVTPDANPLVVQETGSTAQFTVRLGAPPTSPVVFDVTSDDPGEVTVSTARLTFTSGTWSLPQTVTVTGVDDPFADGDQAVTVTLSVDPAASADAFDGLADQTVDVTVRDNEVASFTVTPDAVPLVVSETGTTADFTVVLGARPETDVVFDVTIDAPDEATVSTGTLTFTTDNWSTPQTVTVTGVDDALADGDQSSIVTVAVNPASADAFDVLLAQTVAVTTTDDEPAPTAAVRN